MGMIGESVIRFGAWERVWIDKHPMVAKIEKYAEWFYAETWIGTHVILIDSIVIALVVMAMLLSKFV